MTDTRLPAPPTATHEPASATNGADFDGRVALITGGAGGIGVAIARELASRGASLVLADVDRDAVHREADALAPVAKAIEAIVADVSTAPGCEQLVRDAEARCGRIDLLINNAGFMGRLAPIWELRPDDWQRVIDVDLSSVFHMCRSAVPGMRTRRVGAIVNISSIAGKEGTPHLVPYSTAKAGIIALTKALAKEVVADGVRVNCVAPGVIATRLLDQLSASSVETMRGKAPMGRFGTVEEVAAVVAFLASDRASYVTGQCYDVSGGRATY